MGAGLLAKTAWQVNPCRLKNPDREQARSHKGPSLSARDDYKISMELFLWAHGSIA
ncbi:hypothetical protein EMIT0P12_100148 [Pseudomonas sp. IT-P12]